MLLRSEYRLRACWPGVLCFLVVTDGGGDYSRKVEVVPVGINTEGLSDLHFGNHFNEQKMHE